MTEVGGLFLQQKYFDSGDYQMAKQQKAVPPATAQAARGWPAAGGQGGGSRNTFSAASRPVDGWRHPYSRLGTDAQDVHHSIQVGQSSHVDSSFGAAATLRTATSNWELRFFLPHFFLSVLAFPLFHLLLSGCNFSFFFSFSVATFRCLDVPRTASTPSHQTHTLPSFVNAVLSSLPHSLPILARPRPFVDDQLASGTTRKHDPLIGNMNDCDNQYSVHPVNVEQSLFLATVGRMNRSLGKSFRLRYPKERSLRVLWEVFVQ